MVMLTFKIRELPGTNITAGETTWNYFFKNFAAPLNWEGKNIVTVRISGNNIEVEGEEIKEGRYISIEASPYNISSTETVLSIRGGLIRIKTELSEEEEILEGINDDFDFTTDAGAFICPRNGYHHQKTVFSPQNLENIANAVATYIRNHQDQFYLSPFIDLKLPRSVSRPWYSPLNTPPDQIKSLAWISGVQEDAGSMRRIEKKKPQVNPHQEVGAGGNPVAKIIHPSFFTEAQYERIKNALGDDVSCKVAGCYNNYEGTWNNNLSEEQNLIFTNREECTKVENGMCMYHKIMQNIGNAGNQNNTNNPPPHQTNPNPNNAIDISDDEYNNGIRNWNYDNLSFARFKELEAQIFGEDPRRFSDQALVSEISNKINEIIDQRTTKKVSGDPWRGREITPADDEATKNNLKKLYKKWIGKNEEGLNNTLLIKKMAVIDLMESLLENGNPPPHLPMICRLSVSRLSRLSKMPSTGKTLT